MEIKQYTLEQLGQIIVKHEIKNTLNKKTKTYQNLSHIQKAVLKREVHSNK